VQNAMEAALDWIGAYSLFLAINNSGFFNGIALSMDERLFNQ
jgi:hypothetical protein